MLVAIVCGVIIAFGVVCIAEPILDTIDSDTISIDCDALVGHDKRDYIMGLILDIRMKIAPKQLTYNK